MKEIIQRNRLAMSILLIVTLSMVLALITESKNKDPIRIARAIQHWGMKAQIDMPKEQQNDLRLVDSEAGFYLLPINILANAEAVVRSLEERGLEYKTYERSNLVESIRELRAQLKKSGAAKDTTFAELRAGLKPSMSLSSVKITASSLELMLLYFCAVLFLLLLLLSNTAAMQLRVRLGDRDGYDWLFFHPGRLGPGLFVIWLASPVFILTFYIFSKPIVIIFGYIYGLVLFAFGVCYVFILIVLIKKLRPIRKELLKEISPNKANSADVKSRAAD